MHQQNISLSIITIGLIAILSGSCKKENASAKSLTGSWVKAGTTEEFYIATSDNKWYAASKDYDGYKIISAYKYEYTGTQLKLQGVSNLFLYNTRYSGDTLILNDGNTDYLKLLPSNTAPKSPAQWVHVPTVVSSFADTAGVTAITYYGGHIYALKNYPGSTSYTKLFEFDPAQQRIVHEVVTDQEYDGLDFLDGTLWASSANQLYHLNTTTGINSYSSPSNPSANISALAAKSDGIYAQSYGNLQVFDPVASTWSHYPHSLSSDVKDLAYVNGYLLFGHVGLLYSVHPYYLQPGDGAWYLEGYNINCVAYDGTYYWVGAQDLSSQKYEIMKLQLD